MRSCAPQVPRDLAWLGLIERTKFEWRGITKLVKEKKEGERKKEKTKGTTTERKKERKWNMEKKEIETSAKCVNKTGRRMK